MNRFILAILTVATMAQWSCNPDDTFTGDCFVPEVNVAQTINMSFPEFFKLQNIGEHLNIPGGNRGIFLVHNFDCLYYAVERTCTYQSDNECSTIHVDSTTLQLKCGTQTDTGFVKCCDSRFSFDSRLLQGPARCNLKTYPLTVSGTTILISN